MGGVFPEAQRAFAGHIPAAEQNDLLAAYYRRLTDSDPGAVCVRKHDIVSDGPIWEAPDLLFDGAYALDVLAGVLDGNSSARLNKALVREQQVAQDVGVGYDNVSRGPSLFVLEGTLVTHKGNFAPGNFVWFPQGMRMEHGGTGPKLPQQTRQVDRALSCWGPSGQFCERLDRRPDQDLGSASDH